MNKDVFSGKWDQFKGKIKEKWGKLTDDDLTRISGKREQLLGKLRERYGWENEKAEEELKKFEHACGCSFSGDSSKQRSKANDLYKGEDRLAEENFREKSGHEKPFYKKNERHSDHDFEERHEREERRDEKGGPGKRKVG
jgi:uncharacterized protein YjbJ (UPF0337 family)